MPLSSLWGPDAATDAARAQLAPDAFKQYKIAGVARAADGYYHLRQTSCGKQFDAVPLEQQFPLVYQVGWVSQRPLLLGVACLFLVRGRCPDEAQDIYWLMRSACARL